VLELDSVASGYGGVPIIRAVSFAAGRGEIVAIVGRNGVGKTTLVRTIVGLLASYLTAGTSPAPMPATGRAPASATSRRDATFSAG
jgi:ABC-type branched-subunit amino acid transport system ATPase component